jgi:hypothetical protein
VPTTQRSSEVQKGVYNVRIASRYFEHDAARQYILNEFTKNRKYDSYDFEVTREASFFRSYYECTVTMPGSTPVEDLPKMRVLDVESTAQLVGAILAPLVLIAGILMFANYVKSGV